MHVAWSSNRVRLSPAPKPVSRGSRPGRCIARGGPAAADRGRSPGAASPSSRRSRSAWQTEGSTRAGPQPKRIAARPTARDHHAASTALLPGPWASGFRPPGLPGSLPAARSRRRPRHHCHRSQHKRSPRATHAHTLQQRPVRHARHTARAGSHCQRSRPQTTPGGRRVHCPSPRAASVRGSPVRWPRPRPRAGVRLLW